MVDNNSINRRRALEAIGTTIVGTTALGSQAVGARRSVHGGQQREAIECLKSFDPRDQEEVEHAVGCLFRLENRDTAGQVIESLPSKRVEALERALKNGDGIELEVETGMADSASNPRDQVAAAGATTTLGPWYSKVILRSKIGLKEAEFRHYVKWDTDGETVSNVTYWKEVKTGGIAAYYEGTLVDKKVDMGNHVMTVLQGKINLCAPKIACWNSLEPGLRNHVYPDGTVWSEDF